MHLTSQASVKRTGVSRGRGSGLLLYTLGLDIRDKHSVGMLNSSCFDLANSLIKLT